MCKYLLAFLITYKSPWILFKRCVFHQKIIIKLFIRNSESVKKVVIEWVSRFLKNDRKLLTKLKNNEFFIQLAVSMSNWVLKILKNNVFSSQFLWVCQIEYSRCSNLVRVLNYWTNIFQVEFRTCFLSLIILIFYLDKDKKTIKLINFRIVT